MISTPKILALGEALIEFARQPDEGPRPIFVQGFGGDTSNAVIAAARQGGRTGYITAVGGDQFGKDLIALWKQEGVSTEHVIVRKGDPTGCYFVLPHASGRNFSYARRGSAASLFGPEDLPLPAIASTSVFHSSAISQAVSPSMRKAVQLAAETAAANGTIVSFDTNLRLNLWSIDEAREALDQILPFVDILFPSDDEARLLTGLAEPRRIVEHFLERGAGTVLLKRGAEGSILATEGQLVEMPPEPSCPVDATGAGDSFAGSFLAYFLETGDAVHAARQASRVAAEVVGGVGAIDAIPRRSDS